MALIKCRECSKEISSIAAACPNCGAPTAYHTKAKRRNKDNVLGGGFLLVLLGFVSMFFLGVAGGFFVTVGLVMMIVGCFMRA